MVDSATCGHTVTVIGQWVGSRGQSVRFCGHWVCWIEQIVAAPAAHSVMTPLHCVATVRGHVVADPNTPTGQTVGTFGHSVCFFGQTVICAVAGQVVGDCGHTVGFVGHTVAGNTAGHTVGVDGQRVKDFGHCVNLRGQFVAWVGHTVN